MIKDDLNGIYAETGLLLSYVAPTAADRGMNQVLNHQTGTDLA